LNFAGIGMGLRRKAADENRGRTMFVSHKESICVCFLSACAACVHLRSSIFGVLSDPCSFFWEKQSVFCASLRDDTRDLTQCQNIAKVQTLAVVLYSARQQLLQHWYQNALS